MILENHYQYVLVGGGLTSSSAAEAIRQRDPHGSILLVGQEVNRPYHRPRLHTQYLKGERGRVQLIVQPPQWFAQQCIDLSTGRRAAHLDAARRAVTFDNGDEVAFDSLLLATGASPRLLDIPGAHLPNVFALRSLDDAERLHHAIDKALAEGMRHPRGSSTQLGTGRGVVAIVGAGLLGVELGCIFTSLGLGVELIVGAAHPWKKFAGENIGRLVTHHLESGGVRVRLGQRPLRLDGDGRVQRIALGEGESVACDFVVGAIGAMPNKDLLRGTPITSEKAILVDDHCRTNVPGIFAAGDCAAIFDPLFAKHRVIDHWENARATGAVAGANMAGGDASYQIVNHFNTRAFDLKLECWGEARLVDRRHIRGNVNVDAPDFIEIGVAADGRIAQVLAVGHSTEDRELEALVKQRRQHRRQGRSD